MKTTVLITLHLLSVYLHAQPADTIRIFFLYGSRPAKGYKQTEGKRFGGLKGGHVNLEIDGRFLDFGPIGKCHLFPDKKNPHGGFTISNNLWWDTLHDKTACIAVPVTREQKDTLFNIMNRYSAQTPYDYASFGQRCASASYEILSQAGIVRRRSRLGNLLAHFYPKPMRKKMFRWAAKKGYAVRILPGSERRKWEKDEGPF